jgi:hypothetical protein
MGSDIMKYRIAMWASAGFLVVCCWQLYILATAPTPISADPTAWITRVSCPIVFLSFYFNFGVKIGWVLLANTATYALLGWFVEALRRTISRAPYFSTTP